MKLRRHFCLTVLTLGLSSCVVSCDRPGPASNPTTNVAAPSVRSSGPPLDSSDFARHAASGLDSLLAGKAPSSDTQNFFTTYNNASHTYVRNPACFAAGVDTTCLSVANSANADGTGGNRGCVTLLTPLQGVTNHHFAQPYGIGVVHYFVDRADTVYARTVVKAEQAGAADIEVVTFDSPLPVAVRPAQLLPSGAIARLLPAGTPLLATNQQKQAIVTELVGMVGTDLVVRPALAAGRRAWTSTPPGVLGDSDSPTFVLLGSRSFLLFTYYTSVSGPALSENLGEISGLLSGSYTLDVVSIH